MGLSLEFLAECVLLLARVCCIGPFALESLGVEQEKGA